MITANTSFDTQSDNSVLIESVDESTVMEPQANPEQDLSSFDECIDLFALDEAVCRENEKSAEPEYQHECQQDAHSHTHISEYMCPSAYMHMMASTTATSSGVETSDEGEGERVPFEIYETLSHASMQQIYDRLVHITMSKAHTNKLTVEMDRDLRITDLLIKEGSTTVLHVPAKYVKKCLTQNHFLKQLVNKASHVKPIVPEGSETSLLEG
jgi:hypothetical protein